MNDSVLSGRLHGSDDLWKAIKPLIREVKGTQNRRPKTNSSSECSSKPSSSKPEPETLGVICPESSATGYPLIIAFAAGKEPGFGSESGGISKASTTSHCALFIGSPSCERMHHHASGGGQQKQAMGKSRGGLTTKLHAACADERTAVSLSLSPGQSHDATTFQFVWEGVPKLCWLDAAVMDKAYDSDNIR